MCGRGRSRGFPAALARRRSDDDSGCSVKGSRVSLFTSIMSRRPTTNHEYKKPHLALGAGGACESSLLRMDGVIR